MRLTETLKKVLEPAAPSGGEFRLNQTVKDIFRIYCDRVEEDRLGNVIGLKKGLKGEFKVMLAAHMDEIGLMVKQIDDKGFIRFAFVGGVDQRILPAQEVVIHGRQEIKGIIGNKPPHIQEPEERKKSIKSEDMFIDTGLPADEVKKLVRVGDFITLKRKPLELLNDTFSSSALDDRAGIAAIIVVLQELNRLSFSADVYAVATVQEEVGLRGAIVSSFSIYPHIGVAIDVCHANMPDVPEEETQKLGRGPVLALGPNIHPKLFHRLKELADDYKIPYQIDPEPSSTGTDAWAMQITREGIPTALVSIPLRYMHTTVETLALDDIKMAGRLLALFISSIDDNFVGGLACY
ncbi:M42 family metallopeptidase [Thermoanaerobacterium sp. DL9XJH110]|uniref:M42 family metallopeptidase n=1 Tax=Thermoanaerobacterium sp. DL9XJH110 TaxID=3386643 RepID=UPI003BB5CCDD